MTDQQHRSTQALALHVCAILQTAMPSVRKIAATRGVLLTKEALNLIEDTAATCVIQSAIIIAKAGGYAKLGIDFSTVDSGAAWKIIGRMIEDPEFMAEISALQAAVT